MAQEAVDVCLHVLKESTKRSFDSCSVRNSVLIISHNTFWDCRVHIFADNLSQNSCVYLYWKDTSNSMEGDMFSESKNLGLTCNQGTCP